MDKLQNEPDLQKAKEEAQKGLEEMKKKHSPQNTNQPAPEQDQPPQPKSNFPTEIIDLPSKGLVYREGDPLASGQVELKYMTAREEDILATETYIKNNVVVEKLLRSLIVSNCNYDNLLLGDRNALMIAARIYGYGPEYVATVKTPSGNEQEIKINLEDIEFKEFDESQITQGQNEFSYTLPVSGQVITFKLLTVGDEKQIQKTVKGSKRHRAKFGDNTLTTRMAKIITSIDGDNSQTAILNSVANMLARDARAFRNYYSSLQPDVDLEMEFYDEETGEPFRSEISLGINFLYPDYEG